MIIASHWELKGETMNTQIVDRNLRGSLQKVEIEQIKKAVGYSQRIAYECAHVYPLSAPNFRKKSTGDKTTRPVTNIQKLYIHIPFCNYACRFCFYTKKIGAHTEEKKQMVSCLLKEMELIEPNTTLSQLYIGGGTPTALPPDLMNTLLSEIAERTLFSLGYSFAIECSPESLTTDHLDSFIKYGVNRISMGVDSLNPHVLNIINRRHNRNQALAACEKLLNTGSFINIDLIYGLPDQTIESFLDDLYDIARIGPHSFTLYNLRLNEQTPLLLKKSLMDTNQDSFSNLVKWRTVIGNAVKEIGYKQTRWHTFVREDIVLENYNRAPCVDGFSSGKQLGIGPSALSHLGYNLYRNTNNIQQYLRRMTSGEDPVESTFELKLEDQKTLFVARTLGDGQILSCLEYENTFGHQIEDDFGDMLNRLNDAELLIQDEDTIELSAKGKLVYDSIMLLFYPTETKEWLNERQSFFINGKGS